ncbi:hypothetical protein H5410_022271 [Solanum commersonii]|uniref:SWIM-type domain-containing protein n=1 Tax=Solanum commersonii TaxID=4109 RepID=A0A9J5ZJ20_SOLCO|nr:hypothetical protein H5410_022271 [Solanum commersonii]
MAEEYILVRFHHGGSFIKAPNLKYVGEGEIKVTPIDKDHFSLVELSCYAKDIGQILNIVSHFKHGAFLDLFISHAVNRPILVEERVPFEFSSELGVVQNSENSINMGSRVALGEHPQLIARDATTGSYVIEQEETTDIRGENVNAKEDDSDLPSNLDSSESELDNRKKKENSSKKKRKVPVPTPEVELGEAGADKGFDDIIRLNKRDKLCDYADIIKKTNPGSSCWVRTDKDTIPGKTLFVYFYVCFDALKRGWLEGCRKIIGLDGCFLKGLCKGELLVAVEHRRCARHIWSNWSINWKGEERRKQFWRCAKASYEVKLKDELAKLAKPNEGICGELLSYNKEFWCKAFFSTSSKCDIVENNMSETFNSWIVSPRHKSIITMLEEIRHKIMNRHVDMRRFANTWITNVSPMARLVLEENKDISKRCKVLWNGDSGFEISEGNTRFIVDQVRRTCTCRSWQLRGIPCPHAVCAFYHLDQEPENEIESWYRHEVFLKAYQYSIQPIPNMKMWPESNNPSIEPPEVKPMPGRPRRCRRKQKDEPRKKYGKLSKKGVKMTCSRCHQLGHNKSACKSVNMNPPSMCTDTFAVKRNSQSQSTGRGRGRGKGRGRGYFATNATGRGNGKDNDQPTNNGSTQPTTKTKKPKHSTGFGIYTDIQSGRTVLNPGITTSERVISPGTFKDASPTNIELGFKPYGLKWKGKNAWSTSQLQQLRTRRNLESSTQPSTSSIFQGNGNNM